MAVKRRNKSIYISVYSYTIPAFEPKNPVFPGIFVSIIYHKIAGSVNEKNALFGAGDGFVTGL